MGPGLSDPYPPGFSHPHFPLGSSPQVKAPQIFLFPAERVRDKIKGSAYPRISLLKSACYGLYIIIPWQFHQGMEDSNQAGGKKATNTYIIIYFIAYLERAEFVFFKSAVRFQIGKSNYGLSQDGCYYEPSLQNSFTSSVSVVTILFLSLSDHIVKMGTRATLVPF